MHRRAALTALGAALMASAIPFSLIGAAGAVTATFEVTKTQDEWKKLLPPEAFKVLRLKETEVPFSSKLDHEVRKGVYACAGCDLALFISNNKFDSGTGWPSFWQPLPNAVQTSQDYSFMMDRTEVHCRRCGGHLGHLFDDGPKPTGLRYCMNGAAMVFKAA